jgi:protein-S-isoprenylcysteine O-methyltransferase Ste14
MRLPVSPGRWLFRFRSLTPVPIILGAWLLCWRDAVYPGPGGAALDDALNVAGVGLVAVGWLWRFVTVGFTPHGSQTRILSARALCTTGPYALVRHPLYLGNALIVTGLLLIVHRPAAYLLVGGFFVVAWGLIIAAEERHLRDQFGDAWHAWAAKVPMVVPRPTPGAFLGPFHLRLAVRREVNPLTSAGLGVLLLLGWEWWARGQLTAERARPLEVGVGVLLGLLVANKAWKKASP